jgi:hypothetical protein
MTWHPAVIAQVRAPDGMWDGVGKGPNRNAARVESGGAGALSKKPAQSENFPVSNSCASCQRE